MVDPIRYDICPACECRVDDRDPGVSCITVDGVMYHPEHAPLPYYRKWTRHIEEERARIEAEASRLDFDKLFLRVAEEVARQAGIEAADRDFDRIERELAAIDLLESVGLGPEVAE